MKFSSFLNISKDYWTILLSRCFDHRLYARFYLGSSFLTPVALHHYLLEGEKENHRPTPFFHPSYYRTHGDAAAIRGNLFAHFLRSGAQGAPCAEFDADWYAARHIPSSPQRLSPWRHFMRIGLKRGYDPAPHVSIDFILRAYHKPARRLLRALFDVFQRREGPHAAAFPLCAAELQQQQNAFRAKIDLRILKQASQKRHDVLVYVQTAGGHPKELEEGLHQVDGYDLMLNYYIDPMQKPPREADYVVAQWGSKATAINALLTHESNLLLRYDYILFLDDDIEIDATRIKRLFQIMREHRLDCAQPALTPDSFTAFKSLMHDSTRPDIVPMSAVEIMMPLLSRRALETCGQAFGLTISGWGIDLVLGAEIRKTFGQASLALINAIAARHLGKPDLQGGAFYRFLREQDIDPFVEMRALISTRKIDCVIAPLEPSAQKL